MINISNDERSWMVVTISSSQDCPKRYRKWRPPRDGWFCMDTGKKCSMSMCRYRTEKTNTFQLQPELDNTLTIKGKAYA